MADEPGRWRFLPAPLARGVSLAMSLKVAMPKFRGIKEMGTRIAISAALIWLVLPALAWAKLDMQPGLWEMATQMQGRTLANEQKCYLQKDIDALEKFMQGAVNDPKQPCVNSNYKASGNTVTYTMSCTFSGHKNISDVSATYAGDHTTGTIKADGSVSTIASKRLGACNKSSFDK